MPIAKKPIQTEESSESEINAVISKGGSVARTEENSKNGNGKILLRLPNNLLNRIDTALTARPLKTPRNTWILEAILEKLERN